MSNADFVQIVTNPRNISEAIAGRDFATIVVFDPDFPFDPLDSISSCGNPRIYRPLSPEFNEMSSTYVIIASYYIDDPVRALGERESRDSDGICSFEAQRRTKYAYYEARVVSEPGIDHTPCPVSDHADIGAVKCRFSMTLYLASSLVTTQKSARGIDTLRILTDEGSIIGGVLFLTWFLGIFVL